MFLKRGNVFLGRGMLGEHGIRGAGIGGCILGVGIGGPVF